MMNLFIRIISFETYKYKYLFAATQENSFDNLCHEQLYLYRCRLPAATQANPSENLRREQFFCVAGMMDGEEDLR